MYSEKFQPEHCIHTCNPLIQKLKQEDCPKTRASLCEYQVSQRYIVKPVLAHPSTQMPLFLLVIAPHKRYPFTTKCSQSALSPGSSRCYHRLLFCSYFVSFSSKIFLLTPGEQELCTVHYNNNSYICFAFTMASPSTRCFTYNSVNIIAILEAGVTSQFTKEDPDIKRD